MSPKDEQLVERLAFLEGLEKEEVARILRESVKEALTEWLDSKILTFGKWSLMTLAATGLAAFVYFIAYINGWRHSP